MKSCPRGLNPLARPASSGLARKRLTTPDDGLRAGQPGILRRTASRGSDHGEAGRLSNCITARARGDRAARMVFKRTVIACLCGQGLAPSAADLGIPTEQAPEIRDRLAT